MNLEIAFYLAHNRYNEFLIIKSADVSACFVSNLERNCSSSFVTHDIVVRAARAVLLQRVERYEIKCDITA